MEFVFTYKHWKFNKEPSAEWKDLIDRYGCPHDPRDHSGTPLGMYHCPLCGNMVVAGCAHTPIDPETLEPLEEG